MTGHSAVKGNDYTYANSMFTAGYVIGQWPSALILSSGRISPRFWFPFCMLAWGLCTLGLTCELHLNSGETSAKISRGQNSSTGLGY